MKRIGEYFAGAYKNAFARVDFRNNRIACHFTRSDKDRFALHKERIVSGGYGVYCRCAMRCMCLRFRIFRNLLNRKNGKGGCRSMA
ncbi:MAG: hypothetical protein ACLTZI_15825 [[Eubacterium] siraeum]